MYEFLFALQNFVSFAMWNSFINLLFPRTCMTCGELLLKEENVMCLHCFCQLPGFQYPIEERMIRQALDGKMLYQSAYSWLRFNKGGTVQDLLHAIKYGGDESTARWAGMHMARKWKASPLVRDIDIVIPVPIHPRKKAIRGYNQSEEIAIGFVEEASLEMEAYGLIRTVHSSSNTQFNRWERARKMKEVFAINPAYSFEGKRVALLDDVLTTGATIEACAHILWNQNIKDLTVLTLARAI